MHIQAFSCLLANSLPPISFFAVSMDVWLAAGSGFVLLVGIFGWLTRRKQKQEKDAARERLWQETVHGGESTVPDVTISDNTLPTPDTSQGVFGVLTVVTSDNPQTIGQRFEITKPVTRLGRKADNDIVFHKDSPVSRHHAVIDERGGNLLFSEVITLEDGQPRRPVYGTFVNEKPLDSPVFLKNGDLLRLGKRVRLRVDGLKVVDDSTAVITESTFVEDQTTNLSGHVQKGKI